MRVMLAMITAVSLVGCDAPASAPHSRVAATAMEISDLRRVAEDACRCNRATGASDCWGEFQKRIEGHREGVARGTACEPVSTSVRCFDEDEDGNGGFCVAIGHTLVTSKGALVLCSDREVEIVETGYESVLQQTRDGDKAAREAERLARALIRGENLARPAVRKGCGA